MRQSTIASSHESSGDVRAEFDGDSDRNDQIDETDSILLSTVMISNETDSEGR